MGKAKKIIVEKLEITIFSIEQTEYISLTDMARYRDAERTNYIIQNWMRTRNAIEFCGLWEQMNNPGFKSIEFDAFKNEAGSNSFSLTPQKWIEATNAIGLISKSGRYGGTYAHKDIAFEFGMWISPKFKLFLIKEFQRLKDEEKLRIETGWDVKRLLSKINYHIHTDAIKSYLLPPKISLKNANFVYANEADVLNVALFGLTAKEWREKNKDKVGNIRDYALVEQLVVLVNLESLNAQMIIEGLAQNIRLEKLNKIAITQIKALMHNSTIKKLQEKL